jgi:exportin-5
MTSEGLSGVLTDLASIRSEKKAANRVKEMLLQAAGGPDALRAFAEAKAAATSVGAIQVPVVQAPRAAAAAAAAAGVASQTWSEEDVNAIGLNPLTANVRATQ